MAEEGVGGSVVRGGKTTQVWLLFFLVVVVQALLLLAYNPALAFTSFRSNASSSSRFAAQPKSWTAHERDSILSRNGEYFKLDRL